MLSKDLSRALERYSSALSVLEETQPQQPSTEQILTVLVARDALHESLIDGAQRSVKNLVEIFQLDNRLKRQTGRIARTVDLAAWRASIQPSSQAWWWFVEEPPGLRDRFDWLWSTFTILTLTISLGFVADISSRFLSGGPDTWTAITIVSQSILTLLAAGGALTLAGQEVIKRILSTLKVPAYFKQEARLILANLLLGCLIVLRLSLPSIAIRYNNVGLEDYKAGRFTSAQFNYSRAIKLNPDYIEAHYNLGLLYEYLQQIDKAQVEYLVAVQGGLDAAYNNLARLYILEGDYAAAVPFIKQGLLLTKDGAVKYDLHKNMGWTRLEQNRQNEAIVELQAAIALKPNEASAHCLIAQVLERQGNQLAARMEWETCLKFADSLEPDEDTWIGMARQHLAEENKR